MSRERPINLHAHEVRAIREGRQTQLRRVVKLRHDWTVEERDDGSRWPRYPDYVTGGECDGWAPCPYGQPGDRLWVREAWDFIPEGDPGTPNCAGIRYWADAGYELRTPPDGFNPLLYGKERRRSPMFMPRWASRITLEIASVRVQRLQDISEADARAEGVRPTAPLYGDCGGWAHEGHRDAYMALCESIHGPGSWDANPWVWAVQFPRVSP